MSRDRLVSDQMPESVEVNAEVIVISELERCASFWGAQNEKCIYPRKDPRVPSHFSRTLNQTVLAGRRYGCGVAETRRRLRAPVYRNT